MLPTPERIRAARRFAVLPSLLVALLVLPMLWFVLPAPFRLWAIGAGLLLLAVLPWWSLRRWRRRRRVVARGLDQEDLQRLEKHVAFFRRLPEDARQRFAQLVAVFLDEVPVHGVGCELDRLDRLLVAASAVIPIFGFPAWEYDGLQQVLLRPEHFDATFSEGHESALEAYGMVADSGLFGGTMIMSRPQVREGFADAGDGHNVGIHEFAHLVDRASGGIDGLPPGMPRAVAEPWYELVRRSLHTKADQRVLRAYGYTNAAEFFAVGSEVFFENPEQLRRNQPELYDLLTRIYRQHTAGRRTGLRLRAPKGVES
jgi:Mlc titration factor MtfA (ptsG expression regulator)